jgi:hypothetical protein
MKKQARTKNRNFWRDILNWLRLFAKNLWRKFVAAGKPYQEFSNEPPH